MSAAVAFFTDGSAAALVLARWLAGKLASGEIREARSDDDLKRVVAARRAAHLSERLVVLSECEAAASRVINGSAATRAVSAWLSNLQPIDARTYGHARIDEQLRAGATGAAEVEDLARRVLLPERARTTPRTGRRGRPPGANPFGGVGFDVCVALLERPGPTWSERELATRASRDPAAVHRVLVELGRRGYIARGSKGTRLAEPELLRDDLLAAWRGRVGVPRAAAALAARGGRRDALKQSLRLATRAGKRWVLAGASALGNEESRMTGAPTVYLENDWADVLSADFEEAAPGLGEIVVWPAAESGVFQRPTEVRGLPATNPIVTYLDLAVTDSPRMRESAQALWQRILGG